MDVDKFWTLYSSSIISDYNEALKIKENSMPHFLYRYRSIVDEAHINWLIKEIKSGEIWASSLKTLNDIFDSQPILQSQKLSTYFATETYKEAVVKQFHERGQDIPADILSSENWYDRIPEFIAEIASKTEGISASEFREIHKKTTTPELHLLNKRISDIENQLVRVASMTLRSDHTALWYHYADNHHGVCLEYDTTKLSEYNKNRLFPVTYCEHPFDAVKFLCDNRIDKWKLFSLWERMACIKSYDWKNEEEWRLVINLGAHGIHKIQDNDGMPLSFSKPKRIILGKDISLEKERVIRDCCLNEGISVTKAEKTEYGMEIAE